MRFTMKELKESQTRKLSELNVVIDRLKRDNERLIDIVRDRDDEMR